MLVCCNFSIQKHRINNSSCTVIMPLKESHKFISPFSDKKVHGFLNDLMMLLMSFMA